MVLVLIFMLYVIFNSSFIENEESKILFSVTEAITLWIAGFATLSVFIAYKQMTVTADLQRRQLAIENIRIMSISNKEYRDNLNKLIDYSNIFKQKLISNDAISKDEIRQSIFQGNTYNLTDDGKNINAYHIEILNNFEILAIGIHNNIFDETIIRNYFEEILNHNYNFYREYIVFLRSEEMLNDEKFCEYFEWLYNEWNKKTSTRRY
jgi:hypothetical protein